MKYNGKEEWKLNFFSVVIIIFIIIRMCSHRIIYTDAEKVFNKIQYPFNIKIPKLGIDGNFPKV